MWPQMRYCSIYSTSRDADSPFVLARTRRRWEVWEISQNRVQELEEETKKQSKKGLPSITNGDILVLDKELINTCDDEAVEFFIQYKLRKVWKPKMILVVDKKYTMMGSARKHDDSRSIFTENQAITEIATDHLILDITLAGNRLGFDSTKIVSSILDESDVKLESLFDSK